MNEYACIFRCYTPEEQYPASGIESERKTCDLCNSGVDWWDLNFSNVIISKTIPDEELLMRRIAEIVGIPVYIRYSSNSWKTPQFSNLEDQTNPLTLKDREENSK